MTLIEKLLNWVTSFLWSMCLWLSPLSIVSMAFDYRVRFVLFVFKLIRLLYVACWSNRAIIKCEQINCILNHRLHIQPWWGLVLASHAITALTWVWVPVRKPTHTRMGYLSVPVPSPKKIWECWVRNEIQPKTCAKINYVDRMILCGDPEPGAAEGQQHHILSLQ